MAIIDCDNILEKVVSKRTQLNKMKKESLISAPFYKDFYYRFCWNSNALEGNTLTLDETISVVEYDEVRSGHTYTEYNEAKKLYSCIVKYLSREAQNITKEWISNVNGIIIGSTGEYRTKNLYIGTLVEATYYPPNFEDVPKKMDDFLEHVNFRTDDWKKAIQEIAKQHIIFERIHPYVDGNGRTGRMILNQQLINNGMLPITLSEQSKYRQAFRKYDENGDYSLLAYQLCKGELNSIKRMEELYKKLSKRNG